MPQIVLAEALREFKGIAGGTQGNLMEHLGHLNGI